MSTQETGLPETDLPGFHQGIVPDVLHDAPASKSSN